MVPTDPEMRLTRQQLAEALTQAGFPTSAATLATMATRGGGPEYQCYGRKPLYQWGKGLAWAQARLSAPVRSSAEAQAQSAA